jgi:quinol monooxygenase YgiN
MVIVTFKLHSRPEARIEITQSLEAIADRVRKVKGLIDVQVYRDINNANVFLLVEEWQNQLDLDDHMNSSLFAALLGSKGLLVETPAIKFMTAD